MEASPRRTESPARVEVRGVTRRYPGVTALRDVAIAIHAGEIVGLVGHNGAGKSTLTRILAGAERPDAGEISIDGAPIVLHSPDEAIAHGIALVPQQLLIVPNLSVRENLILGSHGDLELARRTLEAVTGRSAAARSRARAGAAAQREVIAELRLAGYLDVKAGRLRPPVQRLVLIGRALLRNPRVLILDEPTAAFSRPEVELLFSILRSLRERGIGALYISHRLDEVLELADRVVVLRQGELVHEGPVRGLTRPSLTAMVVGRALESPQAQEPRARRAAQQENLLECERLSRLPRVRDVSFVLRRGEVLGVTGVVGSGRTSLLRALCGVERPDSGVVRVEGKVVRLASPRRAIRARIAYLPEDRIRNAIVPEMTVAENVTLPRVREFRYGWALPVLNVRRELAAVDGMLDRLKVEPPRSGRSKIKFLSGGNQQKAMLARWLMTGALVFVFDEPTEGIDVGTRLQVYELIKGLTREGAGVIVSSSDIEEIVGISDRVLIMRAGALAQTMEGAELSEAAVRHACIA